MSRLNSPARARANASIVPFFLFLLLLATEGAFAHAHLDRAEPRVESTVTPAPREVSLSFTEGLEPAFSTVEVRDAEGARMDEGEAQISGRTMRVGLKPLPPGTYKVYWRALSVDTHKTEGTFSFRVGK
jgi:methionine-rich copper-binding protein CopC